MNHEKDGREIPFHGETLFFDTYALYAIAVGQRNYAVYSRGHRIVTSLMNVYELYYSLLRDGKSDLAEAFFARLLPCCQNIKPSVVKAASKFRLSHNKKGLSYIDCLGYMIAKESGILFLTGDTGFREIPGVVFVR